MAKINQEQLKKFVDQISELTSQFTEEMQKYDDFPEEMNEGDFWEQWEAFTSSIPLSETE